MKVASGKVMGGKVVLEGEDFAEGSRVTVVSREPSEPYLPSDDEAAELRQRIDAARRGETVDALEFLAELRRRR